MWKKISTALSVALVLLAISIGGLFGSNAGNKIYQFFSFSDASVVDTKKEIETQVIGSLNIRYPSTFKLNELDTKDVMSRLPSNANSQIRTLSIYTTEPACGIGEINIVKTEYISSALINIDGAVAGAIKQAKSLDGIANFKNSISSIKISDYPARKVSFNANRWGGELGGEILFIEDTGLKTLWQLQLIFESKNSSHEKLNDARSCANEILKNVSIVHPTSKYEAIIDEMSAKCEIISYGQTHEECCKEKNILNCPTPQKTMSLVDQSKQGLIYLLSIVTVIVIGIIFIANQKGGIQNILANLSETTKAAFTGWLIWILIVLSYITLISPYAYIDNNSLVNLSLWCVLPPFLILAIYLWLRRFSKKN